jgi:U4/U6 small nuclear ribonucleoprotein PRP4
MWVSVLPSRFGRLGLWDVIAGQELHRYLGHTDRLGRVAIHPMGRHLGTASFDQTWRLWDLETGDCLLEQEGHSRSVYTIAFQRDGALAASAGLDAVGELLYCSHASIACLYIV